MKFICYLLVFSLLSTVVLAQQTNKPDDALLLDYYQNQRFTEASDYLKEVYTEPVKYYKKYLSLKPPVAKQQSFIAHSKSRIAMLSR